MAWHRRCLKPAKNRLDKSREPDLRLINRGVARRGLSETTPAPPSEWSATRTEVGHKRSRLPGASYEWRVIRS